MSSNTSNKTVILPTEQVDERFADLDTWTTPAMIAAMYEGQVTAVAAVRDVLGDIAEAVEDIVPALLRGGRIIYAGAGTSGRIAVQDGAELIPTFDWPADRVVFATAGGPDALMQSVEGAEDNVADAKRAMDLVNPVADDVVIGVAASGTTPFTVAAVAAAAAAGAVTIAIANNPAAPLLTVARHRIFLNTGPEAIAGSTRMKAGTAQKIVLNLISTAAMVKMGRVYRGQMVHLRATNAKLKRRAARIVADIAGCTEHEAERCVERAEGDVKSAVLLALGLDIAEAESLLRRHGNNLRSAIGEARGDG